MTENEKLVAALTRRLGEKEKENVELEERYSALLDACESLEKQLDTKYKLSKIGECITKNEHPILITGVKIGDADFCVLSQGMVYSLFTVRAKCSISHPRLITQPSVCLNATL